MLTGRRSPHLRHEFRFGAREVVAFGGALLLVCGLTFALGVLVGRELGAGGARGASGGAGSAGERGRPARPAVAASEERLTFYQTLTAPTQELPSVKPPAVEERLVVDAPAPAKPSGRPERRQVAAATPSSTPERSVAGRPAAAPPPREAAAPSSAASPGGGAPEAQLWTVQVSSFRSRVLAEELRARLASRGLDAYLVSMSSEEGRVRHRVRVGAFASRAEAERVATELRSERSLNPFVTTRIR